MVDLRKNGVQPMLGKAVTYDKKFIWCVGPHGRMGTPQSIVFFHAEGMIGHDFNFMFPEFFEKCGHGRDIVCTVIDIWYKRHSDFDLSF